MKYPPPHLTLRLAAVCLAMLPLAACKKQASTAFQGYVEGEFVYVSCPLPGRLEKLSVARGAQVQANTPLFTLESTVEKAARDEADRRLTQARATVEDLKKGLRPTEVESMQAQILQAEAALSLAEREYARLEKLTNSGAISKEDIDRARSTRDQNVHKLAQLEADLKTGRLGARVDQIAASEANVKALEATLEKVEWDLAQKQQAAPQSGLVFDTLYRAGEWVPAGKPVVAILPPQNVKVRAFIPQERVAKLQTGNRALIRIDGIPAPVNGRVSFISPQPEYTPPVIYSRENRAKLMFMIEIAVEPGDAANLHPGQPVDLDLVP